MTIGLALDDFQTSATWIEIQKKVILGHFLTQQKNALGQFLLEIYCKIHDIKSYFEPSRLFYFNIMYICILFTFTNRKKTPFLFL